MLQIQSAHGMAHVDLALLLERQSRRVADEQKVEGHAALRIDRPRTRAMARQELPARFVALQAVVAAEHLERAFPPARRAASAAARGPASRSSVWGSSAAKTMPQPACARSFSSIPAATPSVRAPACWRRLISSISVAESSRPSAIALKVVGARAGVRYPPLRTFTPVAGRHRDRRTPATRRTGEGW